MKEFDEFVALLRKNGVDVTVVEDTPEPNTPDSIFPNNWISFHSDGTVLLYPMYAPNRRAERKEHVLEKIDEHFVVKRRSISVIMKATIYFSKEPEVWFSTETTGWFCLSFTKDKQKGAR